MIETKCIKDEALNDLETIQRLARVAADPDAHTAPEFDEAYAQACVLQNEWAGSITGLECADVVAAFEAAIKVRRACRKYDLVPRAKLVEAEERFKQADANLLRLTQDIAQRVVSIGPADPEPPPPPPTKALEPWTGEQLYCTAKTAATGQTGVWPSQTPYQQRLWDAAANAANKRMGIKST